MPPSKVTSAPNPTSESGPRRQVSSHGPAGDALLDEVHGAMGTLALLLSHGRELGAPEASAIRTALDEVSARLDRRELRVIVVGEEHSGKSTFLDALLGERLLGMTKTPPNTVTTIRCTPELGYRARLTDGFIEEFALREPDQTAQLLAQIAGAEASSADAKGRSVAAAVEVASAADALERVETAMTDAFRALEAAREEAGLCGAKLETSQQAWGGLVTEAGEHANALPVLFRPPPPWWALWPWVIRLVTLLLNWRTWRRHHTVLIACGKAEAEVDSLRAESSRAAERCNHAEARLSTVNVPVEEARCALDASRRIEREAQTACETLEHEVIEQRRAFEQERNERQRRFVAEVRALSNMEDRGLDVVDLEIDYPASLLPDDIALIETPGVTSENVSSSERAWQAIRERADACILVSELEHAVSGETQRFLQHVREVVPHAVLVLTKMDETLAEAMRKGEGAPAEEVERARRIGTRRFAREMGRDPTTVLSVTVAAEEALRDDPSAEPARRRFETDVATLFMLLRYERALILGASSAGIVRRCIGSLAEAEARAARLHQERITALEAQRIPGPDRFYAEQMTSVERAITESARGIVASAPFVLHENADLARVECKAKIAACKTKDDLRTLPHQLAEVMLIGLTLARDAARSHLDVQADRGVHDLETRVFQAMRERYQIVHEITRPTDLRVVVDLPLARPVIPGDLAAKLDQAMRSFDLFRLGFGLGGAALGAGVGTLVLPGMGSVAGAVVGVLATFAKTFGALKRDLGAVADESITSMGRVLVVQVAAAEPSVVTAMRASLGKSLEHTLARFARSIDEPIREERTALETEREKLRELEALHQRLQEHDARLDSLIKAAADASVGLCR